MRFLSPLGYTTWLIEGDFYLLRKRSEKQGKSFNHVVSKRFNSLIHYLQLVEISLYDKKYTWTRSISSNTFALLDRFICTVSWQQHYIHSLATSLSRVSSDHNPMILHTCSFHIVNL
jgi:hypothetical protein